MAIYKKSKDHPLDGATLIMDKTAVSIIEWFIKRVNERAEALMKDGHRLEGAHYASMQIELERLRQEIEGDDGDL